MSDPTTTNIALAVPTHLSDSGAWDTPMNNNFTELDALFGSVTSKTLSSSDVVLTQTECQVSILRFSGTLTANVTITLTTTIKSWICENNTTGAFTVTISGGSGNVVALPPGSCQVYWDGTNVSFINMGRVGEFFDYVGSSVPAWITACSVPPALNCDGSSFSAVTYPRLSAVFGGGTTLPDLKGRLRANLDQSSGRITTAGSGIDGSTNLSAGGAQNVTIAAGNLPQLSVTITDPGHTHAPGGAPTGSFYVTQGGSGTNISGAAGGAFVANTASATTGITATANTGGANTALNKMPPVCVAGITMIWAV